MKKSVATIVSVIIAGLLIGGAFTLSRGATGEGAGPAPDKGNVAMENGVQVIDIGAKGGYSPRKSQAASGVPTVLRLTTKGTFDCSAALTIPSIGYSGFLPRTGTTDIEVSAQAPGTTLRGLCSMGMYNFTVDFI
ncbi:MAG: hypothetical protein HZA81_01940 [Candidatus Taylorbacteria bacterium]|nr:hypothetical protein [Candidatus Taylorbacteria bacterium]